MIIQVFVCLSLWISSSVITPAQSPSATHGHYLDVDNGKCKYCGASSFGSCSQSPHKKHEHTGIGNKCVYCGSGSYGACSNSPSKKHKHESGYGCTYCGSKSYGSCSSSPSKKHEH